MVVMTLTITTTDYELYVNKEKSVQSLLNPYSKRPKIYSVKVVFGASDTYSTGGVTADLSAGIQEDAYVWVLPEWTDSLLHFQYNKSTGKIQCFTATATPDSSKALTEVVTGSTLTQSKTFTFIVLEF